MDLEKLALLCFTVAGIESSERCDIGSFEKIVQALYSWPSNPDLEAQFIFAMFDLDGDGLILRHEFREVVKFFTGQALTHGSFQKVWDSADQRARGCLTREDYVAWLSDARGSRPRSSCDHLIQSRPLTAQLKELVGSNRPATPLDASKVLRGLSQYGPVLPRWNSRFQATHV